jgi:hypothetical protein
MAIRGIIIHWTAGTYRASEEDKLHYHYLIPFPVNVISGKFKPEDNDNVVDGAYAAHTKGSNRGFIGVSLCCMAGAIEAKDAENGKYAMQLAQWMVMVRWVAQLCVKYNITPKATTVLTHAEVEKNLGISQAGKWDITRLPFSSERGAKAVGNRLRAEVSAEIVKLKGKPMNKSPFRSVTMGGAAMLVPILLQKILGIEVQAEELKTLWAQALEMYNTGGAIAGLLLVIYGRWRADRPLSM